MKQIFAAIFILFSVSCGFADTSLNKSMDEIIRVGFLTPPAACKWQGDTIEAGNCDIKNKIKKNFYDAYVLNKKYPDIKNEDKKVILKRSDLLKKHLQAVKKDMNAAEQKLYDALIHLTAVALNEYDLSDIYYMPAFSSEEFYIAVRVRLLLSFLLYNINGIPEDQKIILRFTALYLERHKSEMEKDFKNKRTQFDYYKSYSSALRELTDCANERYSFGDIIDIGSYKDEKGRGIKGKWSSFYYDGNGKIRYTEYYNIFDRGGTRLYNYFDFGFKPGFAETFYKSDDALKFCVFLIDGLEVKNNVFYITLKQDPLNFFIRKNALYLECRFGRDDILECAESYFEGTDFYAKELKAAVSDIPVSAAIKDKVRYSKKADADKAVETYFVSKNKMLETDFISRIDLNNMTYGIYISYFRGGRGAGLSGTVRTAPHVSFWKIYEKEAVLEGISAIDSGSGAVSCEKDGMDTLCRLYDEDGFGRKSENGYVFSFDKNGMFLKKYENISSHGKKRSRCEYYKYDGKNMKSTDSVNEKWLEETRFKAYDSGKCADMYNKYP